MTEITLNPEAARFLRTLRVATATTLAAADLAGALRSRSTTSFLALAAKGVEDWRFPVDGLFSADGLVRATLVKETNAQTLVLQALGAAGLTRYAGVSAQVTLSSGVELAGAFDRDGALRLPLQAEIAEADLAGFEIELEGAAP
jgi:hypothetical protein